MHQCFKFELSNYHGKKAWLNVYEQVLAGKEIDTILIEGFLTAKKLK